MNNFIRNLTSIIPDKLYLQLMYRHFLKEPINWKNPKLFSEKIQWLKLHDRKSLYTTLVDKIEVKEYIENLIGKEHIIPTIATWDSVDKIDFESLPNQFVLKTNHAGGNSGVIICRDKANFNIEEAKNKLRKSLKTNSYLYGREWPYKNVKRRILAEQLLAEKDNIDSGLRDYKFFCFNGIPRLCQVISDRNTKETIDFYDMDWKRIPGLVGLNAKVENSVYDLPCPTTFEKMKKYASMLSKHIKTDFARIDFYEVNHQLFFGEITLYPLSGFGKFKPNDWNITIGDYLNLSK